MVVLDQAGQVEQRVIVAGVFPVEQYRWIVADGPEEWPTFEEILGPYDEGLPLDTSRTIRIGCQLECP